MSARGGFIKLYRKSLGSAVMSSPEAWFLWCHILLTVNYEPSTVVIGFKPIKLERGQRIFGRRKLAEETGLSEWMVRRALTLFESLQQLTIKHTTKYSVLTVVNWESYQGATNDPHQQLTSNSPANHPQSHQQTARSEEGKEREEENKEGRVSPETPPDRGPEDPVSRAEQRDQVRQAEWDRWVKVFPRSVKADALARLYVHRTHQALQAFYDSHPGRITPTKLAGLAAAFDRYPTDCVLMGMEIFIDRDFGKKDERYLVGIVRRLKNLSEIERRQDLERHRDKNAQGVFAEAVANNVEEAR